VTRDIGGTPRPVDFDVVVAGGGNAGLCAAIVAAESGARVMVAERAPRPFRGGNTRHTRNVRNAHLGADGFVTGAYAEDELLADLVSVTGDELDLELARLAIAESVTVAPWMGRHGIAWQKPLRGTLGLARTNHFFLGGGKSLVNAYYRVAERLGITVRYETAVVDLIANGGAVGGVVVDRGGERATVRCRAFVAAAGGYEANIPWLRESWGPAAERFAVRGTPFNDGLLLRALLDRSARPAGNPRGAHCIAVDARGPDFDGGIVTRLDTVPLGVVVDRVGRRFYDEGEDIWPKRYAIWGRLVAEQADQVAYSIVDGWALERIVAPLFRPIEAASVGELAEALEIPPDALIATMDAYAAAVRPDAEVDLARLDGCGTVGLVPPKSNWARPFRAPPWFAFPLRPGITFTYLGVKVDGSARVQWDRDALEGVFAAGEIMAGNILTRGYLGGFGLTIGHTFGRIAGREAAAHALG
jgi:tricarballylate dehydrogenase